MQNPIQKCRQSSILFEKPGVLSENFKTLTSSNYPTMSTRGCAGFVLFYLDLELCAKIKKTWFRHTRFLHFY